MAASEAIRFCELAQLGRFSFRRVRLFLTSALSPLWRFALFLPLDRFTVGPPFSEASEAKS